MTTPLRQRAHDWLTENPAWESWVDGQHQLWVRLFDLYEQGHTAPEAVIALGLGPEDDVDELKKQLKRQHDTIVNQAGTITRMQAQFNDITKMPDETRAQLIAQAKSLLRRRH
jgi:hypothetical protein